MRSNRKHLKYYVAISIMLLQQIASAGDVFIYPGQGAEGYTFQQNAAEIRRGSSKVVLAGENPCLFRDVFRVKTSSDINFDTVCVKDNGFNIFISRNRIVAIVGNAPGRFLAGGYPLDSGISSTILKLGNRGLSIIKSGDHTLYIYQDRGLALFDDGSDDVIDMYAVFSVSSEGHDVLPEQNSDTK